MTDPLGSTPLDDDEAAGLKLSWVTTRSDLNAAEAQNIVDGWAWASQQRLSTDGVLDDAFLRELHRRMFGDVWKWAGLYRKTEKSIGVDPRQISTGVRALVADVRFWVEDTSRPVWSADEIGARFHYRLVAIHPFPNGNGRHGRAAADLLLTAMGVTDFSWGRANLDHAGEVRTRYINALRAADAGDFGPLLEFVRS